MQLILIDAVHLDCRHQRLNHTHHPLAHIAIEAVVTAEGDNAVLLQLVLYLEVRLAHFDVLFAVSRARNHATIVVSE
jgi:hypothetical protein